MICLVTVSNFCFSNNKSMKPSINYCIAELEFIFQVLTTEMLLSTKRTKKEFLIRLNV